MEKTIHRLSHGTFLRCETIRRSRFLSEAKLRVKVWKPGRWLGTYGSPGNSAVTRVLHTLGMVSFTWPEGPRVLQSNLGMKRLKAWITWICDYFRTFSMLGAEWWHKTSRPNATSTKSLTLRWTNIAGWKMGPKWRCISYWKWDGYIPLLC